MRIPQADEVREAMIFTSREQRERNGGSILIRRGSRLPRDFLESQPRLWQRRRIIAIARTWAALRSRPSCVPTGLSAALLADLPLASMPKDVHLASPRGANGSRIAFPAIRLDGRELAPASRTRHHRLRARTGEGSAHAPYETLALHCAIMHPGEEGFIAVCSALRAMIVGDSTRWRPREKRETAVKRRLLDRLEREFAAHPNVREARWIIRNAEAECESVGEARLLWILRSCGIAGTRVQVPVGDESGIAYIDIAIPDLKIAIEFDGREKYGTSLEEQSAAWRRQNEREHFLLARGWIVVRYRWEDLVLPEFVLTRLRGAIEARGRRLRPVAKPRIRAI